MTLGVAVRLLNLVTFNERAKMFQAECLLTCIWATNGSAAFDSGSGQVIGGGEPGQSYRELSLSERQVALDLPECAFSNIVSAVVFKDTVRAYSSGDVWWQKRMLGSFTLEPRPYSYESYPFDKQTLSLFVASKFCSTQELEPLPALSGVAEDTQAWMLTYVDYTALVGSGDEGDFYELAVRVQRAGVNYIQQLVVPMFLLVIISWGSFYININKLMPRVATAFIAFLTLSNWVSSQSNVLPDLHYRIFSTMLLNNARLFVTMSLFETVAVAFIVDNYSQRTAMAVDHLARVLLPCDFAAIMLFFFAVPKEGAWLVTMETLSYVNIALVVTVFLVFFVVQHRRLMDALVENPLLNHRLSFAPLDVHEIRAVYAKLDTNGDEALETEEMINALLKNYNTAPLEASAPPIAQKHALGSGGGCGGWSSDGGKESGSDLEGRKASAVGSEGVALTISPSRQSLVKQATASALRMMHAAPAAASREAALSAARRQLHLPALCGKMRDKMGPVINSEQFRLHHRHIFAEILLWERTVSVFGDESIAAQQRAEPKMSPASPALEHADWAVDAGADGAEEDDDN